MKQRNQLEKDELISKITFDTSALESGAISRLEDNRLLLKFLNITI